MEYDVLCSCGSDPDGHNQCSSAADGHAAGKQGFEGLIPNLRRRYEAASWTEQEELEPYRSLRTCPTCHGARLKTASLSVKVKDRTIADYVNLPIGEALKVFEGLQLTDREALIADRVLKEIQDRLRFLNDVGVGCRGLSASSEPVAGRLADSRGTLRLGRLPSRRTQEAGVTPRRLWRTHLDRLPPARAAELATQVYQTPSPSICPPSWPVVDN